MKLKISGPMCRTLAMAGSFCLAFVSGLTGKAAAQEIEPYEFTPLPAGSNIMFGYYVHGQNTQFNVAKGPTYKGSLDINVGTARYVHFWNYNGIPVGIQLFQTFGSLANSTIAGQQVGSAFGAQNLALSAFIFPYVNPATKTNTNVTVFLYPPTGTYDPQSAVNLGDNRWRGNLQLGLTQGLGDHFGFDAEFDAMFFADNNNYVPGGRTLSQDPSFRAQFWANYRWNAAFTTSLGYTQLWGGNAQVNKILSGSKTEEGRIRANAAVFVSPRAQVMLELNHDVHVTGGYKQDFGAVLRVGYLF